MYSVEFSQKARKFFNKLSEIDKKIIAKKISSIQEDPYPYLKKLQGSKLWRLRIMKYRVVIDVIVTGKRIVVLKIGLRKNVYD